MHTGTNNYHSTTTVYDAFYHRSITFVHLNNEVMVPQHIGDNNNKKIYNVHTVKH